MISHKGMMTSNSDEWTTPKDLIERLEDDFDGFDLDPCSTDKNFVRCHKHFTREDDGLKQDWSSCKNVFMNPPYGRQIGKWVKKAYEESLKGCVVVCLLPARTDTAWFHDYVLKHSQFWFLRGRLHFGGCENAAPFPSMIAVFRQYKFLKKKEVEG